MTQHLQLTVRQSLCRPRRPDRHLIERGSRATCLSTRPEKPVDRGNVFVVITPRDRIATNDKELRASNTGCDLLAEFEGPEWKRWFVSYKRRGRDARKEIHNVDPCSRGVEGREHRRGHAAEEQLCSVTHVVGIPEPRSNASEDIREQPPFGFAVRFGQKRGMERRDPVIPI